MAPRVFESSHSRSARSSVRRRVCWSLAASTTMRSPTRAMVSPRWNTAFTASATQSIKRPASSGGSRQSPTSTSTTVYASAGRMLAAPSTPYASRRRRRSTSAAVTSPVVGSKHSPAWARARSHLPNPGPARGLRRVLAQPQALRATQQVAQQNNQRNTWVPGQPSAPNVLPKRYTAPCTPAGRSCSVSTTSGSPPRSVGDPAARRAHRQRFASTTRTGCHRACGECASQLHDVTTLASMT